MDLIQVLTSSSPDHLHLIITDPHLIPSTSPSPHVVLTQPSPHRATDDDDEDDVYEPTTWRGKYYYDKLSLKGVVS
jgi:hypothetical protein